MACRHASRGVTAGASEVRHVVVQGMQRRYQLYLPAPADGRPGVVLAFHGGFASAEGFVRSSGFPYAAVERGLVVAVPTGIGRSWNAGPCCGPAHELGVDDVAFAEAILADIEHVVDVDPARTYATGFSNGAMLTYLLGCRTAERFAAIAPVSAPMEVAPSQCRPAVPVPVLHLHGELDEYSPLHGGMSAYPKLPPQPAVPDIIRFWVQADACTEAAEVLQPNPRVHCFWHPGGSDGTEVELCTVTDLGHQWPGGPGGFVDRLGPPSDALDANTAILDFFARHHR